MSGTIHISCFPFTSNVILISLTAQGDTENVRRMFQKYIVYILRTISNGTAIDAVRSTNGLMSGVASPTVFIANVYSLRAVSGYDKNGKIIVDHLYTHTCIYCQARARAHKLHTG